MPLKSGNSNDVVSSNIKELMKSGRNQKQSIAIALANKRKFKKMAMGGMVNADFDEEGTPMPIDAGDEDKYMTDKPSASASLSYQGDGPEDGHRSIVELDEDADYDPSEVANPEMQSMADAMRRQYAMGGEVNPKLAKVPMKDRFAMGGLVDDPGSIHDSLGSKPEEDREDSIEDQMTDMMASKAALDHAVRNDSSVASPTPPKDTGISEEMMQAIRNKKMKRRYPTF